MRAEWKLIAHWGPREESINECTERLYRFLQGIAPISPHLATWYGKAWSREAALAKRIPLARKSLRQILHQGRERCEVDRTVFEEEGFHIAIWNGGGNDDNDDASLSLSVRCGQYEKERMNSVELADWPEPRLEVSAAVALVRVTVDAWAPDWASICSCAAVDDAIQRKLWHEGKRGEPPANPLDDRLYHDDTPFVDWIVFHRLERRLPLPAPARVAFKLDGGECIVVQDTPVHVDNAAEMAQVRAVARTLPVADRPFAQNDVEEEPEPAWLSKEIAPELKLMVRWGLRKESIDECAGRIYRFLQGIAPICPEFATWYDKRWDTRMEPRKKVQVDHRFLRTLVRRGRYHCEREERVIEEIGFSIEIWQDASADAISLRIHCGAYDEPYRNWVEIADWPESLLDVSAAVELVRAAVEAWSPDWAGICSSAAYQDAMRREIWQRNGEEDRSNPLDDRLYDDDRPFVDWIVYHRLERREPLPPHARVAFELDGGECIVVQETPVYGDDAADLARVHAVARALGL